MLPCPEPSGTGDVPGWATTVAGVSRDYRYSAGERLPVEVLVFEVAPEHAVHGTPYTVDGRSIP